MFSPLFLHIPHSSVLIPEEYRERFRSDPEAELPFMTDWYTDELFGGPADRLVFPVSRLVCDPERFRDDEAESMSRVGMGAVYTRGHDRRPLRDVSAEERESILRRWYDPHHRELESMTARRLEAFGRCLILDCHSFHPVPLPYEPDQRGERPDICIGTDPYHTPVDLADLVTERFRRLGYSVMRDSPYSGTIVPLSRYGTDPCVFSLMIEVNRELYLDNTDRKEPMFEKLKDDLTNIILSAESWILR